MIVSDASPLINLAVIGKLYLLRKLYGEITIPAAVLNEIVVKGKGQPGSKEIKDTKWINKVEVKNTFLVEGLTVTLDREEAEAIALAKEQSAELLIVDEKSAREIAHHLGVNYIGLLGMLREAKEKGLIKKIKSYLDLLRKDAGFWLSDKVYQEILSLEGE